MAPSSNATKKKAEIFKAIVFFLPTMIIGGMLSLLPSKGRRVNRRDRERTFEYEMTIVAIIKNEGDYLKEWLYYHHHIVGVDKFVIYDNESTDNTKKILKPYVDLGLVEYVYYPGVCMQCSAYTDGIRRYKNRTRYIGFIDLDEFVVVKDMLRLVDVLEELLRKYPEAGGMVIPWYNFGTSGHIEKPEGLVIENYLRRAPIGFVPLTKTVGNPRLMSCMVNPHKPIYKIGVYNINENGEKCRLTPMRKIEKNNIVHINHYFTKSENECRYKFFSRGRSDEQTKRKWKEFIQRNRNDIYDDELLKFVPQIKALMDEDR